MRWYLVIGAVVVCATMGGSKVSAQAGKQPKQPKQPPVQFLDEKKFEIKHHINCAAFSPDGKLVAMGEDNVHLWDVSGDTPSQFAIFKTRVAFGIRSIQFSPDGKLLACGGADNNVRVWDVASQTEVFVGKSHRGDVNSLAFTSDGKILASASNDKTVILWDVGNDGKLTERSVIKAEDKFGDRVRAVTFVTTKKDTVLVAGCSNGTFRAYTLGANGVKQTGGFKGKGNFGDVNISASPDSKLFAISDHKLVYIISATGAAVGILDGHKENVRDVAFSPDGKLVATAGNDGTLHVWNLAAKGARITKERPGHYTAVAWAPSLDGNPEMRLAACLDNGDVWILRVGPAAK